MAQVLAKENRYLSDFQTFTGSLAAHDPAWLQDIRQQALARFTELGFPTARRGNEKWKYTSVVPIANATFEYPFDDDSQEVKPADLRRLAPWDDGWVNLVFVDGRYSEALSTSPTRTKGAPRHESGWRNCGGPGPGREAPGEVRDLPRRCLHRSEHRFPSRTGPSFISRKTPSSGLRCTCYTSPPAGGSPSSPTPGPSSWLAATAGRPS